MKPSQSYAKAATLTVVIIVIALIMSVKPDPAFFESFFAGLGSTSSMNLSRKDMAPAYADSQKVQIQGRFAGYWKFNGLIADHIILDDRIEFKDNGIIWRYTSWTIELPSGDSATVSQMSQAYASPYAPMVSDSSIIACEAQVIKQVNMHAPDTCYSTVLPPELWTIGVKDSTFILGGRSYYSYKDSNLAAFFPAGGVKLVEDPRVVRSPWDYPILKWIHDELAADSKKLLASSDPARILEIVDGWYVPLCLRMAYTAPTGSPITSDTSRLAFEIIINPDGSVKDAEVKASGTFALTLRKALKSEMAGWKFPATKLSKPLRVKYDSRK